MRSKYLFLLSSIVIIAIIIPLFPLNNCTTTTRDTTKNELKTSALAEINTAIDINDLPGSPTNWTWAKIQGYCTGDGTISNPYVISDYFFNTTAVFDNCLEIQNSRRPFIIEDCVFKGITSLAGIKLTNTSNGLLRNNKLYPLTGALAWIYNSSLNEINNNNVSAAYYYGIIMDGGLGLSSSNIISDNIISFNLDSGIYFTGSSINNQILRNTIYNNTDAIKIFSLANNNTIHSNIIRDNLYFGIGITTDYNTIYNNCFINNGFHAEDDGFGNKWDYGLSGNYWDNYTGSDNNNDGIGDIPHNITGSAGSKDYYPLMECPLPAVSNGIPCSCN